MNEGKEPSRNITLLGVVAWIVRSGAFAGIVVAIVYVGMTYQNVLSQKEQMRAHEQDQKADVERIHAKNAAQDEKLAEQKETQVKLLMILEQHGRALARLEERNEKALARLEEQTGKALVRLENKVDKLENKVDRMDDFLRGGENSAGLDEEGSAANVSARLCM